MQGRRYNKTNIASSYVSTSSLLTYCVNYLIFSLNSRLLHLSTSLTPLGPVLKFFSWVIFNLLIFTDFNQLLSISVHLLQNFIFTILTNLNKYIHFNPFQPTLIHFNKKYKFQSTSTNFTVVPTPIYQRKEQA